MTETEYDAQIHAETLARLTTVTNALAETRAVLTTLVNQLDRYDGIATWWTRDNEATKVSAYRALDVSGDALEVARGQRPVDMSILEAYR